MPNAQCPMPQVISFLFTFTVLVLPASAIATTTPLRVVVNSNQDSPIQPDEALTLREAIEIVNGTLPPEKLSQTERSQVSAIATDQSRIEFNLPPQSTTIRLTEILPPLSVPVVVDGTTQPGWETGATSGVESASFPRPVVTITPASGQEVFRGLVVISDKVTIRGLSLYGFTSRHRATASTPPGDILIASRSNGSWVTGNSKQSNPSPNSNQQSPPKNVLIEYNWLGIPPVGALSPEGKPIRVYLRNPQYQEPAVESEIPVTTETENDSLFSPLVSFFERYLTTRPARLTTTSAFGVYVFNSLDTTIRRNVIANHDGSAIITAVAANNLRITENILTCNGFAGMPDAIRLEGVTSNTEVVSNQIFDNAGSAIYLFKPTGVINVRDNTIASNGRRYKRAAIYLMGDEHQVINNRISNQPGPGVAIAAFPNSDRNVIRGNQFSNLQGLSIDLVTQLNTDVHAYAVGDGPNPRMTSHQRRRKTGNFGIDAPRFLSREFFISQQNGSVTLAGSAQPDAVVEIYRVTEDTNTRGPLNNAIAIAQANDEGQFSVTIPDLQPGEQVSAIAIHPQYGTSEPAVNALIRTFPN